MSEDDAEPRCVDGIAALRVGIFVLRVRLGGTDPPRGTIAALGETAVHPFSGWVELMSAINRLRGWECLEPGSPGS